MTRTLRPATCVVIATGVCAAIGSGLLVSPAHAGTVPAPEQQLHIQFTGKLKQTSAKVVEVDGEFSTRKAVRRLNKQGKTTICYISAGTWEKYRSDRHKFPDQLLGRQLADWPGERWLDIRKRKPLRQIMRARIKQCERKGFAAVEFDNVDGYSNRSGFALRRHHQLKYNRTLANLAKRHNLSPGLKNAVDLVGKLQPHFDWALNEQCFQYRECGKYIPFTAAGKAVFTIGYRKSQHAAMCRSATRWGLSGQTKKLKLNGWTRRC